MLVKQRICPECKDPIIGRSDKKFCGDICRTAFHNSAANQRDVTMREINKVLLKNRRILLETASDRNNVSSADIYLLQDLGFDFSYYTHCRPDRAGQVVVYCYEVGYIRNQDNRVQIIRKGNR